MKFTYDFPNSGFVDFKWVWSEILELVEEIKTMNLKGIRNELCDVYTCTMYAIEYHTGIPMPIFWLRSANGWKKRTKFWELYLAELGLEFKIKYMKYGSNYLRPEKRRKIFELAVEDQIMEKETDDPRYPWTHAADFVRIVGGYSKDGITISRRNASRILREVSKIMGLNDRHVAEQIAKYFLEECEFTLNEFEILLKNRKYLGEDDNKE